MNTKPSYWLILINVIWVLVIFILCVIPSENIPSLRWNFPHFDKVVHFGMYFIMAVFLIYPLQKYTQLKLRTIYTIAILASFVYGGFIEVMQEQYFNRSGDIWDLVADVLGGICGCLCYPLLKRIFHIR